MEKVDVGALTVRVSLRDLEQVGNLIGELVIDSGIIEHIGNDLGSKYLLDTVWRTKGTILSAQDLISKMRMVTVDHVFERFPRMIRNIATSESKKIEFITQGKFTLVDRAIVESLSEPLVHLIRNAASHGIEDPDTRKANGKSPKGTITLSASQEQNDVVIKVADDGKGISIDTIRAKAIEYDLLDKYSTVSDEDILDLIFSTKLSTKEDVSEVSGRGIGLSIVKEAVELTGGSVSVVTEEGVGTSFTLRFPAIAAVTRVLAVRVNERSFILPLANITRIISITKEHVFQRDGRPCLIVNKKIYPILDLGRVLFNIDTLLDQEDETIILWEKGAVRIALLIEEVAGIRDVVMREKAPDSLMSEISGISGATTIAGGEVVYVLNPEELEEEAI